MAGMRRKNKQSLDRTMPPSQFGGGCNSGSTTVANLLARTHAALAILKGLCLIQLFIDVKTAFASMVKALAIPMDCTDAVFFERLRSAGFDHVDIQAIWH
eukprot:9394035-Karenia_brevis.AAC.1